MSDIAKCNDIHCPSKNYCYRYTAPAGMWQSYVVTNRECDADNCNLFWPNGKCRYCQQENDNHKMSCPTMKIQVNL